jgi:hypothetical protein
LGHYPLSIDLLLNFEYICFIFKNLLYYCCTRSTLWQLQKFLQYIIVEFTPPSLSFKLSLPFLGQIQQVSFFQLHIWVHNISTLSTCALKNKILWDATIASCTCYHWIFFLSIFNTSV